MKLTHHAQVRMQQRGIRPDAVDCLVRYGRVEYDHHGSRVLYFDHGAQRGLSARFGGRTADRLGRLYAVVGNDGAVLTVGHRTRRIWRH